MIRDAPFELHPLELHRRFLKAVDELVEARDDMLRMLGLEEDMTDDDVPEPEIKRVLDALNPEDRKRLFLFLIRIQAALTHVWSLVAEDERCDPETQLYRLDTETRTITYHGAKKDDERAH